MKNLILLNIIFLPLKSLHAQSKVYNTNLQTAYNPHISGGNVRINNVNNYDHQAIPDSVNFGYRIAYIDDKKTLEFYPLEGKWNMPFIMYPASAQYKKDDFAFSIVNKQILSVQAGEGIAKVNDSTYDVIHFIVDRASVTFENKMTVCPYLYSNNPAFIIFGDFDDQNRIYWYHDGKVSQMLYEGKLY